MTIQSTKNKTSLGILLCGHSPDKITEQYGQYSSLFVEMLGPDSFNYQFYAVVDGEFPSSIQDADAWLITGSMHGAYDPLPWIPPLENFIRDAYEEKKPMVGICFGHQILSQALGGKVEKFNGGWVVGTSDYDFAEEIGVQDAVLNCWHQDQVIKLPDNARSLGSSKQCQYAAIAYGDHAVSLQPHPEFEDEYMKLLMEERGTILPEKILNNAADSLGQELTNKTVANWLTNVLKGTS